VGCGDEELLGRLRAGDADAFERLVRDNGSWMLGLARRLLGDEMEAEDAVQDACLSAFRSIHAFNGDSRLATWLHRIVVNAALMRLRSRRRRSEAPIDSMLPSFLPDRRHAAAPSDWKDDPSASLVRKELRDSLRRAVEALPRAYRTVFVLRDVEGLEMEEVARLLDLSVAGAKTRLHRARQALREQLAPVFGRPRAVESEPDQEPERVRVTP
jgi:RNA polymerase sigma-70 factor (ECF subfamily)